MQNGPYGITSRANIFLAAYSTIESLHLDLETLDKMKPVPTELVQSIKGKSDCFKIRNQTDCCFYRSFLLFV